jgi:hypothetical protein
VPTIGGFTEARSASAPRTTFCQYGAMAVGQREEATQLYLTRIRSWGRLTRLLSTSAKRIARDGRAAALGCPPVAADVVETHLQIGIRLAREMRTQTLLILRQDAHAEMARLGEEAMHARGTSDRDDAQRG